MKPSRTVYYAKNTSHRLWITCSPSIVVFSLSIRLFTVWFIVLNSQSASYSRRTLLILPCSCLLRRPCPYLGVFPLRTCFEPSICLFWGRNTSLRCCSGFPCVAWSVRFRHSWLPLSCRKSSVNSWENSTSLLAFLLTLIDELLRNQNGSFQKCNATLYSELSLQRFLGKMTSSRHYPKNTSAGLQFEFHNVFDIMTKNSKTSQYYQRNRIEVKEISYDLNHIHFTSLSKKHKGAFVIYRLGAVCQSCILQGLEKNPKCTQGRCGYSVVLFLGSFTGGWRDSNDHDNPHTTLSTEIMNVPQSVNPFILLLLFMTVPV